MGKMLFKPQRCSATAVATVNRLACSPKRRFGIQTRLPRLRQPGNRSLQQFPIFLWNTGSVAGNDAGISSRRNHKLGVEILPMPAPEATLVKRYGDASLPNLEAIGWPAWMSQQFDHGIASLTAGKIGINANQQGLRLQHDGWVRATLGEVGFQMIPVKSVQDCSGQGQPKTMQTLKTERYPAEQTHAKNCGPKWKILDILQELEPHLTRPHRHRPIVCGQTHAAIGRGPSIGVRSSSQGTRWDNACLMALSSGARNPYNA